MYASGFLWNSTNAWVIVGYHQNLMNKIPFCRSIALYTFSPCPNRSPSVTAGNS